MSIIMASRNAEKQIGLAIAGSIFLIFFAAVIAIVVYSGVPTRATGGAAASSGKLTRDEFKAKYTGKTKEEILKALGKPKSTSDYPDNTSAWHYDGMTRDPISGKNDSAMTIWIDVNGKVNYIDF